METYLLLSSWIFFGCLLSYLARKKGKSPRFWFLIGIFFGLIGLLILLFSPKKRALPQETNFWDHPFFSEKTHEQKLWHYVDKDSQTVGPVSFERLKVLWKEKQIEPTTYVWNEDFKTWKKVQDFL